MKTQETPPPLEPPPPATNQPYLFTPQSTPQPQVVLSDIDWANLLLSAPPPTPLLPMSSENINNISEAGQDEDDINKLDIKRRSFRKISRKVIRPRVEFQTKSSEDILDDGYRWRKYGQKSVKNSIYPRSYYRCTHHTCSVKKQVQRLSKDTSIVVTTYEGIHNHPCEKLMETLSPLLNQIQFLASI